MRYLILLAAVLASAPACAAEFTDRIEPRRCCSWRRLVADPRPSRSRVGAGEVAAIGGPDRGALGLPRAQVERACGRGADRMVAAAGRASRCARPWPACPGYRPMIRASCASGACRWSCSRSRYASRLDSRGARQPCRQNAQWFCGG